MATPDTNSDIWDEIECSESYLVCCMFDKAASLASSVVQRILKTDSSAKSLQDIQLADMMESAGMVFVQSLRELGRSPEIMKDLKSLFGSAANVPAQVLLTGACFQISDGSDSGLCEFLDEFLGKWNYVDGQFYILATTELNGTHLERYNVTSTMEVDKYLEVVELYAVALLAGLLNDTDHAIAWVENAELPDEKRHELIRRLRCLCSLKTTSSSQSAESHKSGVESTISGDGETWISIKGIYPNAAGSGKQTITERMEPCFWWFRTVSLKIGGARLVVSHGKIALWGSFIIFIYFLLQKKGASLKQIAGRHAWSMKKALVDLWQLAFSVQVNPLAAVQPHPRGNR